MSEHSPFRRARPVWSVDDPRGFNRLLVWRAAIAPAARPAELVIAAATTWRLRVDGVIIAEGPARAAHGWAKVDRLCLPTGARRLGRGLRLQRQRLCPHRPAGLRAG